MIRYNMDFNIGMAKLYAEAAKSALETNLPNPWLAAYVRDVPPLLKKVEELEEEVRHYHQTTKNRV